MDESTICQEVLENHLLLVSELYVLILTILKTGNLPSSAMEELLFLISHKSKINLECDILLFKKSDSVTQSNFDFLWSHKILFSKLLPHRNTSFIGYSRRYKK